MQYREGTIDDCKGIYDLICELEGKQLPIERFSDIYKAQCNDGRYYCLVCVCDERVIGVLNLRFEEQLHHADRIAEVLEFSIHASFRSQGIGKEMFANACRIAEDFGCSQIELATNQLRTDAHRFYSREGMNNFHYKFSKSLVDASICENAIGR